jgi:amidase
MDKIAYLSAKDLVSEIKSKSISSVELTELYINRIEEYDVAINAVVVRTFDQVLEDAKKQI